MRAALVSFSTLLFVTGTAVAAAAQTPLAIHLTNDALQWGPCPSIFGVGCEIAVLRGNPVEPNADVVLRVPANFHLPPHSHSSAERMMLVTGRMQVRYQGNPASILTAGSYAFGPAALPHEARCLGPESCTLFIAFEGPVDAKLFEGAIE